MAQSLGCCVARLEIHKETLQCYNWQGEGTDLELQKTVEVVEVHK